MRENGDDCVGRNLRFALLCSTYALSARARAHASILAGDADFLLEMNFSLSLLLARSSTIEPLIRLSFALRNILICRSTVSPR